MAAIDPKLIACSLTLTLSQNDRKIIRRRFRKRSLLDISHTWVIGSVWVVGVGALEAGLGEA